VNARDLVSVLEENECDWSKFSGSNYLIAAAGTTRYLWRMLGET
jgi:hypothetical protein